MSFLNDSFGPQNQEDKKNILIEDNFEIENEDNNNNNTLNSNNSEIINEIIKLKFKLFFKSLISIFKIRDNLSKIEFFSLLKSKKYNTKEKLNEKEMDQKDINKTLLSHILLLKLKNSTKNIFYIYKNAQQRKKLIYFDFWKRSILFFISIEKEINTKNSYDKKINELNKQIKNINKKRDNLKQDENKINQNLQQKEEQKNGLQKNLKNLTLKLKKLEKEKENLDKDNKNVNNKINAKNNNNNNNNNGDNININLYSVKNKENEEKKIELETNLKQMKEEDLINDKKFKNFINNFEKNLDGFKSRAEDILRQKNQKSLEINKGDFDGNDNIINNMNINNRDSN